MFLLISRSLDHDKNETEIAFDTRLIAVTHEASMDDRRVCSWKKQFVSAYTQFVKDET